ncbi:MAG: fasciclin domain-containing protein [Myxococcus sp.]|nr:fasciclin domain-containing protein [Myxococcus sp.]
MKKLLVVATIAVASVSFAQKKDMKAPEAAKEAPAAATKDLVDTAVAAGSFTTLAAALKEAGLIETLKGKGPFTVFAPTDEAFAKIAKKDLDALLKDKKKLTAVLTYHVVGGSVMAADVVKMKDGSKVKTVEGREFTVGLKDGKVTVDGANVVKTDIAASNGVIHVIDTVIMPR